MGALVWHRMGLSPVAWRSREPPFSSGRVARGDLIGKVEAVLPGSATAAAAAEAALTWTASLGGLVQALDAHAMAFGAALAGYRGADADIRRLRHERSAVRVRCG